MREKTGPSSYRWWETGVIYQVYVPSFQDSDGDGMGDLRGVIHRLKHIPWLGADIIWLSPISPSPMVDWGYDVSDYTGVNPMFGTLADVDELLQKAHAAGLKVVLDYVPNHTSDRHRWFLESRSSPDNPKRDWYIWRDPRPDGSPPNNWLSNFGGSAWAWDHATRQYYYHAFFKQQPDLNWRNPKVQQAMLETMRFWLDRGVDGFRMDVIWHLVKDEEFRDNPSNPLHLPHEPEHHRLVPAYSTDQPEVHEVISQMRSLVEAYGDRLLIGEIYLPVERLIQYYGSEGRGIHLPFNFQLLLKAWNPESIHKTIEEYEAALPSHGWPNWVLSNHDWPRIASRVGKANARLAALLLLTLRGTPTIYYGDEIGMTDVQPDAQAARDPLARAEGDGAGRDGQRSPMRWDSTLHAGFTTGTPWLPLSEDYRTLNIAVQAQESDSMLALYRQLLALRQTEPALQAGALLLLPLQGEVMSYIRESAADRWLVALNFSEGKSGFKLPEDATTAEVVLSTYMDRKVEPIENPIDLRPHEGLVLKLAA